MSNTEYHFRFQPDETESWDCILYEGHYADGNPALITEAANTPANQANDLYPGETIAVLTVNMPEESLGEGEVIIKTYSENAGIVTRLLEAGILHLTGREVITGQVTVPVCTYTLEPAVGSKETL